jgi:hypothetical protein
MPRYFLDWSDGKEWFHDEAGVELKTAQSIEAAAAKAIPDIARDRVPDGEEADFMVAVRDERRDLVLKTRLIYTRNWVKKPS